MKSKMYVFCLLSGLTLLSACGNNNQKEVSETASKNNNKIDSAFVNGSPCDIKLLIFILQNLLMALILWRKPMRMVK